MYLVLINIINAIFELKIVDENCILFGVCHLLVKLLA